MRVSTVLTCLWIGALYQDRHGIEIEADDVALLLRRVIDEVVDALDIVVLARAVEGSADRQRFGEVVESDEELEEDDEDDEEEEADDD